MKRKIYNVKDCAAIARADHSDFPDLANEIANTTAAFGRLGVRATADGTLPAKTKELIAVVIAMAGGSASVDEVQALYAFDEVTHSKAIAKWVPVSAPA